MVYWEMNLEPIQYTDDIYYVGVSKAPCWVIKSTDGLILIDTAYPNTIYLIMHNMRKLGLDYMDIKHIIHSHGHLDHFGGTRALVELTGAKTYIGEADAEYVRGNDTVRPPIDEPFEPDVLLHEGDVITIGNKTFNFISTPGHTPGTMSIFFDTTYKAKTYRAGMFGGAGINTLYSEYLNKFNYPFSRRDDFMKSIERLYTYEVDVHVGNHLGDNGHKTKMFEKTEDFNPFIDNTSWRSFLERRRKEAQDLIDAGK